MLRPNRRAVLRWLAAGSASALSPACTRPAPDATRQGPSADLHPYDGKVDDLILHAARPPNLEMPARYLEHDLTPNDAFFVRWHLSVLPTVIDERTYRLRVGGAVERPLELSLTDLRTRFPATSLVAVCQCSGNSRRFFSPRVPGVQWGNGAMGNAKWTGARLGDVLAAAGVRPGSVDVAFNGLDTGPLDSIPDFQKSLSLEHALQKDTLLAWAMNDAPIPMLNGFPVRLIVPGWYATYWVKSLATITVTDRPFDGFWMKKAYLVPANPRANESPDALSKDMVPIARMNIRSVFDKPIADERIATGKAFDVQGVAWDAGSGIARVEVSTDAGATWKDALLGRDYGGYSWRRWRLPWIPAEPGPATLVVRATSKSGEQQDATPCWNRSGYMKNDPEHVRVVVS